MLLWHHQTMNCFRRMVAGLARFFDIYGPKTDLLGSSDDAAAYEERYGHSDIRHQFNR